MNTATETHTHRANHFVFLSEDRLDSLTFVAVITTRAAGNGMAEYELEECRFCSMSVFGITINRHQLDNKQIADLELKAERELENDTSLLVELVDNVTS
jgi:hypothetical protein